MRTKRPSGDGENADGLSQSLGRVQAGPGPGLGPARPSLASNLGNCLVKPLDWMVGGPAQPSPALSLLVRQQTKWQKW